MFEARLQTARRVLDLSFVPPATHDQVAVDSSVHLYEVLSRIDLPPADQIPGPEAVSGANPPDRWIVPGTDITLVRITQGERRGDYLFSADTVRFAANSSALVRCRPASSCRKLVAKAPNSWPSVIGTASCNCVRPILTTAANSRDLCSKAAINSPTTSNRRWLLKIMPSYNALG